MKISKTRIVRYNLAAVFFWMMLYLYVPYITPYLNVMVGMAASVIGYISSFYGADILLNRIPFGLVGDKTGAHKKMCIVSIVPATVAACGMQITNNPMLFRFFRLFSRVRVSSWVNFATLYTSYFEDNHTSRAVPTMNPMSNIGRTVAAVAGR